MRQVILPLGLQPGSPPVKWKGEEDLPGCPLTHLLTEQFLFMSMDGCLLTLDFRRGSEAVGKAWRNCLPLQGQR